MKLKKKIKLCVLLLISLLTLLFLVNWYKKPQFKTEIFQDAASVMVYSSSRVSSLSMSEADLEKFAKAEFKLDRLTISICNR